ncbi:MAG: hypothetical protein AB1765_06380 [Candidatus Hydrogenedentota bacterium]
MNNSLTDNIVIPQLQVEFKSKMQEARSKITENCCSSGFIRPEIPLKTGGIHNIRKCVGIKKDNSLYLLTELNDFIKKNQVSNKLRKDERIRRVVGSTCKK